MLDVICADADSATDASRVGACCVANFLVDCHNGNQDGEELPSIPTLGSSKTWSTRFHISRKPRIIQDSRYQRDMQSISPRVRYGDGGLLR